MRSVCVLSAWPSARAFHSSRQLMAHKTRSCALCFMGTLGGVRARSPGFDVAAVSLLARPASLPLKIGFHLSASFLVALAFVLLRTVLCSFVVLYGATHLQLLVPRVGFSYGFSTASSYDGIRDVFGQVPVQLW
ncbi:hypothetical protein EXIGLDRAFT_303514 [Exidia glandulosa HHB12029]|uniref:Uncharacterized protein n=1 Tax=Exidia glandulosa HHB12029 TaxID=1314781 RepID=A0A165D6E1_EXIGL|nr:hypothetical protein EXIGLDRAFT_303514 [Exidia glandulosa HHB12029]